VHGPRLTADAPDGAALLPGNLDARAQFGQRRQRKAADAVALAVARRHQLIAINGELAPGEFVPVFPETRDFREPIVRHSGIVARGSDTKPRAPIAARKCIALSHKGYYTFSVRIEINPSAKRHGISDAEIRTVISYPELRFSLVARIDIDAAPVLHIGRAADNQPHIEVIADLIDPGVAVVFHAMMLRPKLVNALGLDLFITPDYRPQRA
jgi:hypothetical protein